MTNDSTQAATSQKTPKAEVIALPTANANSPLTLGEAWKPFAKFHLERERKCSPATLISYKKDFEKIATFLCTEKPVNKITQRNVRDFAASPHLLHKDMDPAKKLCAEPTVKKTLRLFKMFLTWLEQNGYIAKAPIPNDLPMGAMSAKAKKEQDKQRAKAKAEKEKAEAEKAKAEAQKKEDDKVECAPAAATEPQEQPAENPTLKSK